MQNVKENKNLLQVNEVNNRKQKKIRTNITCVTNDLYTTKVP